MMRRKDGPCWNSWEPRLTLTSMPGAAAASHSIPALISGEPLFTSVRRSATIISPWLDTTKVCWSKATGDPPRRTIFDLKNISAHSESVRRRHDQPLLSLTRPEKLLFRAVKDSQTIDNTQGSIKFNREL